MQNKVYIRILTNGKRIIMMKNY